MSSSGRIIPIYTSRGDLGAYLVYPYIINRSGDWIGWVTPERVVYSVHGQYVGYLDNGPRILRRVSESSDHPRRVPPAQPHHIPTPITAPLAPLMPELTFGVIDVLEESPDLLPGLDEGELREDLD